MKAWLITLSLLAILAQPGFGLTYRHEDLNRGGIWANKLIDSNPRFKDTAAPDGFVNNGSTNDPHHLLGPIPEDQSDTQPVFDPPHNIIPFVRDLQPTEWIILSFADTAGNPKKVYNDPSNPDGYDAILWGNDFYDDYYTNDGTVWSEPGTIYLSQDLVTWYRVPMLLPDPYDSEADGRNQTFDHTPGKGSGLVYPGAPRLYANGSYTQTGYAGGDAFDMSTAVNVNNPDDIGLDWFKYLKVSGETPAVGGLVSGPEIDSAFVFCTRYRGDANEDGTVNLQDLSTLATYYGMTSGADWTQGDFSGDEQVNLVDLSILAATYGTGGAGLLVPEPLTFVWLVSGITLLYRKK